MLGLLADGHILLEGVPGLAKTTAIKTLSDVNKSDFPEFNLRQIYYQQTLSVLRSIALKLRNLL